MVCSTEGERLYFTFRLLCWDLYFAVTVICYDSAASKLVVCSTEGERFHFTFCQLATTQEMLHRFVWLWFNGVQHRTKREQTLCCWIATWHGDLRCAHLMQIRQQPHWLWFDGVQHRTKREQTPCCWIATWHGDLRCAHFMQIRQQQHW